MEKSIKIDLARAVSVSKLNCCELTTFANNKTGVLTCRLSPDNKYIGRFVGFDTKEKHFTGKDIEIVCEGVVAYILNRLASESAGDFIEAYLTDQIDIAKRKSFYDVLQDNGKYIEKLQNLIKQAKKETASATIFEYLDNDSNKLIKDCCGIYIERIKSIIKDLTQTTATNDGKSGHTPQQTQSSETSVSADAGILEQEKFKQFQKLLEDPNYGIYFTEAKKRNYINDRFEWALPKGVLKYFINIIQETRGIKYTKGLPFTQGKILKIFGFKNRAGKEKEDKGMDAIIREAKDEKTEAQKSEEALRKKLNIN